MSGNHKRYSRLTKKTVRRERNAIMVDFVEAARGWPFWYRVRFAWRLVRGKSGEYREKSVSQSIRGYLSSVLQKMGGRQAS
jgi:hypothetical protein